MPYVSSYTKRRFPNRVVVLVSLLAASLAASVLWADTGTAATTNLRYEVETLPVTASSGDRLNAAVSPCPGGDRCVVYESNAAGDSVTFAVKVPEARSYEVKVGTKKHTTRGIYQLSIKGAPNASYDGSFNDLGTPQDLYASSVTFTESSLGTVAFGSSGTKDFRFRVTGKNSKSSGYTLGLDYIILVPLPLPTTTAAPTTTTTVAPTTTTTAAPAPSPTFVHPGIVVSRSQLDLVKSKVAAGQEPWKSAFAKAKGSRYGSLTYTPSPVAEVGCGSYNSPNEGCTAETDDAQAAYTHALLWYYTGDKAHAAKSIEILNAWSGVLQTHKFDTTTYKNGKLQAAWGAETFTKAAEIMRYSNAGWSATDVSRFESMLNKAFLPLVKDGWTGGGANWQMSMAEATMNIGVFTNNRTVFNDGLGDWRSQIKGAIYLRSDGTQPVIPAGTVITASSLNNYWYKPLQYVDGLEQESCRDMGHVAFGFAAIINAAETAHHQGIDLYGEQRQRITAGMEYNTRFINNPTAAGWACPAPMTLGGAAWGATWDIGYNHYVNRLGMSLPQTKALLTKQRPTASALHFNWETLTHATGAL